MLITFLKWLQQRLKQEWQKCPAGTRQTDGRIVVWFGELERKLAKLSKTTFAYCSSSYLFYESHALPTELAGLHIRRKNLFAKNTL
jgi:hypothetical protein